MQLMKGFRIRPVPSESVGEAAKAVARRQAEQLTLVRRRAQPTAVYIARLTLTAVFAYLLALQLPGGSTRSVLAPLTALLVVQATLFHTIGSAIQRVAAVTAGVLAAVAVAAYVPFSWWVLGLLIAGTLALGMVLRLREEILEVPISAMLIFSVDSHAAATSRITETLVGAAAGLAAGLVLAPLRVQPAKDAIGDLSRQMADLLGQMADGLAEVPDPRRAAEWLDRTRALRGEIERVDDALAQAEESVRLNPRRLRSGDPAAGLRDGVDTLERAATDMRVLARSVADSARIDSDHSPVREAGDPGPAGRRASPSFPPRSGPTASSSRPTRCPPDFSAFAAEPITEALEDHLEEAQRQQDQLADLLSTDPAERPEGWQLRGEILAHVDRLRSELEPGRLPDSARAQAAAAEPARPALERRAPERPASRRAASGGAAPGGAAPGVGDRAAAAAEPACPAGPGQAHGVRWGLPGLSGQGEARSLSARRALLGTATTRYGYDIAAARISCQVSRWCMSWQTTRVTALKLPSLPFALEPAGSPPPGCRVRQGVLTLTAAAGTDLFVDPAGAEPGQVPDAGRFAGLPPAGDFTLAAQVSVEFGSMYDAGVAAAARGRTAVGQALLRVLAAAAADRGHGRDQGHLGRLQLLRGGRHTLWLRITRSGAAWAFHASADGAWWRLLRYFALSCDPAEMVRVGFLAQSPTGEGCAATFDHITFRPGAPKNLRDGS